MKHTLTSARFNTVLGIAPGNVSVHSCDYDTADSNEFSNRSAFRNYVDGIFMGYKWQCVEFARRWMYLNHGYVFDDVAMAYDIFELSSVNVIKDNRRLPLKSFKNGSKRHPEPGAMLIWNEGGEFELTGHVAIISEVLPTTVRIIEQNVENKIWPAGQNYSRELPAHISETGEYWIRCSYDSGSILGWVIQTDNTSHAEAIKELDLQLLNLKQHQLQPGARNNVWLNLANPDEAAYVRMMGGHRLSSSTADELTCLCLSESAFKEIKRATNELHALFMHAIDYVLNNEYLLEKFNIPSCLWGKIHQSWENRRNHMITGRFDFSVSAQGIKVYEYNADSSSCYIEAGKIQGKWAQQAGCTLGRDAGEKLVERLISAWRQSNVDSVLHIMQDADLEETYHALFMKDAMETAGIECKIITGVGGLHWTESGDIADADGCVIKWVWKTWAWETALDQIRAECNNDPQQLQNYIPGEVHTDKPRLVDVLLRHDVMVFEPLWTLIPSNKAILAVLWELFPNHPYLLNAGFELNDGLLEAGYVSKPIAGRCGDNIQLFDSNQQLLDKTGGRFGHQTDLYQALFPLPKIGNYHVQLCTFSVDGRYAASCVRVDTDRVIRSASDVLALRITPDDEWRLL